MITQDDLERLILKSYLPDRTLYKSEHGYWYFHYVLELDDGEMDTAQDYKDMMEAMPELETLGMNPVSPGYYRVMIRFTQPPRIVYGDESAELARLRAAGLALVEFAEDYDPENEITCCQVLGCYGGRNHRSEGGEREHAPDCPTRVFTDGTK